MTSRLNFRRREEPASWPRRRGKTALSLIAQAMLLCLAATQVRADDWDARWPHDRDRIWLNEHLWTNPLEDWKLSSGEAICVRAGRDRNIHALTARLTEENASFECQVTLRRDSDANTHGTAGFEFGRASELADYQSSLVHGKPGVPAVVSTNGKLYLGGEVRSIEAAITESSWSRGVRLHLSATPQANATTQLSLKVYRVSDGTLLVEHQATVPAASLYGNLVLVNNRLASRPRAKRSKDDPNALARFAFAGWKAGGRRVKRYPQRRFGPILYTMYTLSRGTLKLTAQLPPLASRDPQHVELWTTSRPQAKRVARAPIDTLSRTATFRVASWPDDRDTAFCVCLAGRFQEPTQRFHGTIRKDPVEKPELVVAGFTGNQDTAFPNTQLVENLKFHNPDLLVFTGDQIYERVGGYGIHRRPTELAVLNYLRKIWLWGWAFRDVMRDRPTLALPDDHDVYQGNIWGAAGTRQPSMRTHAKGGYVMHRDFVNAVQRTQTSHHPDPYDPTPVKQGIGVYYGDLLYGRISFAVIEDRKFKDGPEGKVNHWPGRPDHVTDPRIDVTKLDHTALQLLGERQLAFLDAWTRDWTGADMKCVCSQTIFCNLANYHGADQMYLVADLDSNGWPQSGRNRALQAMRKGFAFHLAGDQHLPSIVHHGIDAWGDAGWSFCVPSIAAGYPRAWRPDQEGKPVQRRPANGLPNTGEYRDGLANFVTVHAIGNPERKNRNTVLELLHDKASGYGLVRFNKPRQTITMECYHLLIDAKTPGHGDQFPGWPKTIHLLENYGREPAGYLPKIDLSGGGSHVVTVTDQQTKAHIYTLRVLAPEFAPPVYDATSTYSITISQSPRGTQQQILDQRVRP